MPASAGPRLAQTPEGLDEQIELLEAINELSDRQGELVDDGEASDLLDVLGRRQVLIERLREVGERPGDGVAHAAAAMGPKADRVRELVDLIAGKDAQQQVSLRVRLKNLESQLGGIDRGRRAVDAYGPKPEGAPRFQDGRA